MLGINFSEWLLILVVGFVVIGPKELPVVIRYIASFIREVKAFTSGMRAQLHEVAREAGVEDILHGSTSTIIDLEGKKQPAYDVSELKSLEAPKVPPPLGGRLGEGQQMAQSEPANGPTPTLPLRGREE